MSTIKLASTAPIFLVISIYSVALAQEPQFRREVDTIPVIINGVYVPSPFAGGINDSRPTLVDIDNDGDLDLFVGENDSNINFYRNTGTVTNPIFTLETISFASTDIGSCCSAPTFADIDNDGDFDLFVGEAVGNINFYRNTGTATEPIFILQTVNLVASIDVVSYSTPTFADIDNDGDFDLFVGEFDGNINFYRNTGIATEPDFTLEMENFGSINVGFRSTPTFADIDNDGDFDLFVGEGGRTSQSGGNINFYRNIGTATNPEFNRETSNFASVNVKSGSAPTFADVDNDRDFDLFVGEKDGNINFYRNTGTATNPTFILETENFVSINDVGSCCSKPTFADIDNDGDLDLFVGEFDGNINFYRNTGTVTNPTFTLVTENFADIVVRSALSAPTFVDIDNDGDFDLFVGKGVLGSENGTISFYRNTGTDTNPIFTLETTNLDSIDVGGDSAPTFADIDNDGDFDLFVGESFPGIINFYRNTGTATNPIFTLVTENFASINVGLDSTPTFADIDSDGDFDLSVGEGGGFGGRDVIRFYRNTGTATSPVFTFETVLVSVRTRSAPTFADIDNDGDFDLFVGDSDGGLHFYRNITPRAVQGDVNSDGVVDVSDLISVINFILDIATPTDEQFAAADVNGDGELNVNDLIAIINIILGIG